MAKPSYEQLEKRVKELEKITGNLIDSAMDTEHHELFELSVLYNVSQALASTMDLDELLVIVIDEVNKALLTEGAGVLLFDENRGDLYLETGSGCAPHSGTAVGSAEAPPRRKHCGLGLSKQQARPGERRIQGFPILSGDVEKKRIPNSQGSPGAP